MSEESELQVTVRSVPPSGAAIADVLEPAREHLFTDTWLDKKIFLKLDFSDSIAHLDKAGSEVFLEDSAEMRGLLKVAVVGECGC